MLIQSVSSLCIFIKFDYKPKDISREKFGVIFILFFIALKSWGSMDCYFNVKNIHFSFYIFFIVPM